MTSTNEGLAEVRGVLADAKVRSLDASKHANEQPEYYAHLAWDSAADTPQLISALEFALNAADGFFQAGQDLAGTSWERGYNRAMDDAAGLLREVITEALR